ncbi:hypothetical protein Ancab_038310 [Ancistrocladus abbreviatus]
MEAMEVGDSSEHLSAAMDTLIVVGGTKEKDEVRVKRKALKAVLEKCHRALELLSNDLDDDDAGDDDGKETDEDEKGLSSPCSDPEIEELCDLVKSRVECPDFLEKLKSAQVSVPQQIVGEEGSSWDVVGENDLWEGGKTDLDQEDYVFVRHEDIVEGIACFMATYLLSLKQTKVYTCRWVCAPDIQMLPACLQFSLLCQVDHHVFVSIGARLSWDLTPNQLQEALRKTFSVKKRKGKLRRAWDGSKVIYNVASWSATAIGIYQNPALLRAASTAFWTSCQVISKLF